MSGGWWPRRRSDRDFSEPVRRLLAHPRQFGRRSRSSEFRGEADVQPTYSDRARLTQNGPFAI